MIPEAGTYAEIKSAVLTKCSSEPQAGEVYHVPKWGWVGDQMRVCVATDSCNSYYFRPLTGVWPQCIYRNRWRDMWLLGQITFMGYEP